MDNSKKEDKIITLKGMYKDYFLDYASYVILERAVPAIEDGLKPVQRRILHSMKRMDDGRFHKVANIIGHTMQFHPHGDAAIGAALVNLGQKDLLIDTQGNWGDIRTGDSAAASRYIEARLTKFALEVAFNPQTTQWQHSYDGRNKEPITLPMKFPLVLAQGVEGIAVGLSTKIMPHNFIELLDASIKILQDKRVKLYPDFQTGGFVDVSDYKDGKRGGKIKVRAKIDIKDKKTLIISELPYGITTSSLIDSALKAIDSGKIKIKKITDNTAKQVEVEVQLAPGISPEVTRDALYAFTSCEVSISPNAAVIVNKKPEFLTVTEILKIATFNTKELLRRELEIKKGELLEKWHMASLEKIFIEKRIYRDIEECENWECVIETIDAGLRKYVATPNDTLENDSRLILMREIEHDDIVKLTEIKIKRISKYNSFKTDELISHLEEELEVVNFDLAHLTDFSIKYFQKLKEKYGKGKERRTEIISFDSIETKDVIVNNAKLYDDKINGFAGMNSKIGEFVSDCSNIDDIIAFRKDGKFVVNKIDDKVFMGKEILYTGIWKKDDDRTTYHLIYLDGVKGNAMAKRFQVTAITRDKEYDLMTDHNFSKLLYFSVNHNGESEKVKVQLTTGSKARKKVFEFDFGELAIKGRSARGNIVTKHAVRKISFIEKGKSSLGQQKYWLDDITGKLNKDNRGNYLGEFDTGDKIIILYKNGQYEIKELNGNAKLDINQILHVAKLIENTVVSAIYFEGEKQWSMVKRFEIETSTLNEKFDFLSDHKDTKLYFATTSPTPLVNYSIRQNRTKVEKELNIEEFVTVKGWKAFGNKLEEYKIITISDTTENVEKDTKPAEKEKDETVKTNDKTDSNEGKKTIKEISKESKVKEDVKKEASVKEEVKKKIAKKPENKVEDKGKEAKQKPKEPKKKPKISDNTLNFGDTIEFDV